MPVGLRRSRLAQHAERQPLQFAEQLQLHRAAVVVKPVCQFDERTGAMAHTGAKICLQIAAFAATCADHQRVDDDAAQQRVGHDVFGAGAVIAAPIAGNIDGAGGAGCSNTVDQKGSESARIAIGFIENVCVFLMITAFNTIG